MNFYKTLTPEQLEEHNSNFIISSCSFSKVDQFSRNPKAFEMTYLYGLRGKSSSTNIAGKAYHEAKKAYWKAFQLGEILSLPELQVIAYEFIESVPANEWKIQKTTPTIADAQKKATKTTTQLLENFYKEKSAYEDHIAEVLEVEVYLTEYITVNGVDIPLPFNLIIDLIIRTHDNQIVLIDHKCRTAFSNEKEIRLSIGKQAIIYVKGYEAYSGNVVDQVWFCENKSSKNQNPEERQLKMFPVLMDDDTRRLYEALLYEPLKKMLEAVQDPDFVYIINDSDNYTDMAELYAFWAKTQIAEIDEFEIDESKRSLLEKRQRKIRDSSIKNINPKVIKHFEANASSFIQFDLSTTNMEPQQKVEHILKTFGIHTQVAHTFNGYSSNTFLLEVSAGTKIASIQGHKLDIANALNVPNVRIPKDLKVYEGKSYLQVETAKKRDRDLIWSKSELQGQKIPIGKDNFERTLYWDLDNQSTPFVLACGAAGSGKSVELISIVEYAKLIPEVEQIIILDPKFEFMDYASDEKIEVYNEILDIENKVESLVREMNSLIKAGKKKKILIVFDEFADAIAASRKGKDLDIYSMVQVGNYRPTKDAFGFPVAGPPKMQRQKTGELKSLEENMRIIKQKGRSVGFRGIDATQRASTKIITGDAKVNYSLMICFRVPKEIDSRVVIDDAGAETLAGMGDGLLKTPDSPDLIRFQSFWKPQEQTA